MNEARVFLQWKGTNACYDFYCPCNPDEPQHFDGFFGQDFTCGTPCSGFGSDLAEPPEGGWCGRQYRLPHLLEAVCKPAAADERLLPDEQVKEPSARSGNSLTSGSRAARFLSRRASPLPNQGPCSSYEGERMFYRPKHARAAFSRLKLGLVGIAALGTMVSGIALTAGSAGATTLTCTNIATAITSPFGCGGLQSAGTAFGSLDLAHVGGYNSLVKVATDASVTSEDWTAYAVGGKTTGGPGGLGEYVAMDTSDGQIADFTTMVPSGTTPSDYNSGTQTYSCMIGSNNVSHVVGTTYVNTEPCPNETFAAGANDLCLSVENAANVPGTNGKLREWDVLRTCNTNGSFTYGSATSTGSVTSGHANLWQAWAPVISGNGYVMINTWLHNHNNVNYVLDITGNGGAGSVVQAYPENDQINEEWGLIGCTLPASHLGGVTTPPYVNCP